MDEFEEMLALEVRRYEHLYNPTMKGHKDAQRAYNAWRKIGETLQTPSETCKAKWQSLRDRFTKARNRMKSKSGDAGGKKVVPSLYLLLTWLEPYIKHRKTTTTMAISQSRAKRVLEICDNLEGEPKGNQEGQLPPSSNQEGQLPHSFNQEGQLLPTSIVSTNGDGVMPDSSPRSQQDSERVKRKRLADRLTKMTESHNRVPEALKPLRDEDELFLLSLLPSLKRLTNKKRMEVRMKFQKVLYEAEFEDVTECT